MEGTIRIVSWFCKLLDLFSDLKIMLLLLLGGAYLGGLVQVKAQFEHDVEFEFTPMDPRDYPEPEANDEDIMPLATGNFEREIKKAFMIMIFFWNEKCEKCKKMKPEFGKAATTMGKENTATPITFASINCGNEGRKVCNKYDVKQMPAIKLFREGEFVKNYAGQGTELAFINFARKELNPGPRMLVTKEEFDFFTDNDDAQIVGFFGMFPTDLKDGFRLAVDKMGQSIQFGLVDDMDLMRQFGHYEDRIVLFRPNFLESPHEDQIMVYDGPSQRVNITGWMMKNYHGLMGLRYEHNQHQFSAPVVHVYFNHDFDLNPKASHYWRNRFMEQAKHFKGKTFFSMSRISDYEEELTHFGLMSDNHMPDPDKPMVAAWDKFGMKFVMEQEFNFDAFKIWLNMFVDGELKPYMQSEDVPLVKYGEGVKTVVANTWEEEVHKAQHDVLIAFHAPWCQHCQMLMPVLKKLAHSLEAEEIDVVIYDATANDPPKYFSVEGFPTIYFLQKNDKTRPILYNAARKHSTFIKFIAEKSTDPLKSFDRKGYAQAYLNKDGAPQYEDKMERLKRNKREGFSSFAKKDEL